MITRKELEYVGQWARRVPYPGDTYAEETMEKLKIAEKLFKTIYDNNTYNITFSNNDEIELEIQARNLAHILGIDFKNLSNEYVKPYITKLLDLEPQDAINSYTILQRIIENSDKVINFDKSQDNIKIMNYYKTSVKCDIFQKLGNLTSFNYGCINFDRNEFEKNVSINFRPNSTKYLYIASDEPIVPYFLIGILPHTPITFEETSEKNEYDFTEYERRTYVIETSIAPENIKPFFQNQEVIIPTQILKDSNKNLEKITPTPAQKKALLKEYRSIISTYNITNRINIYSDYLSLLSQEEKKIKTIKL